MKAFLRFPLVYLCSTAIAIILWATASHGGEIRVTFEDSTTVDITISDAKISAMASDNAEMRSYILKQLDALKIDCGPKCVPKPVEEGVWECCDGRRVPPVGKVKLRLRGDQLQEAFRRVFSSSKQPEPR